MNEKREYKRISVEKLPECLKVVSVKLGFLEEISATTVNASNSGMCFVCTGGLNTDKVEEGEIVTIKISPYNYKLKSKIVYCKDGGSKGLKFGINFHNGYPIEKYHELLAEGECWLTRPLNYQ